MLSWLLTVVIVSMGVAFPYSGQHPVRPKRLFLQHSSVTHHSTEMSLSGVYVHEMDYREIQPIVDAVPAFLQAKEVDCEGIYCGIPSYFPLVHILKYVTNMYVQ